MAGENEDSLTQQLLDITRKMLKTGNSFSLNLSIPNFNFSASSSKKKTPSGATKKTKYKSPSQKKRDYLRKQIYLKQKLDVPRSKDSSEKSEVTEEKDTQKHVTHDRFKCEQCGEKLDNQNYLTNHMIRKHKEPGTILSCDICDFTTSRKISLNIHTSKKHKVIEQLDGNNSSDEECYAESYWERDYMGTSYQTYLDTIENIESENISKEEKSSETERALIARQEAFVKEGQTLEFIHKRWPPWSAGTGYW